MSSNGIKDGWDDEERYEMNRNQAIEYLKEPDVNSFIVVAQNQEIDGGGSSTTFASVYTGDGVDPKEKHLTMICGALKSYAEHYDVSMQELADHLVRESDKLSRRK
ncbi:hypothetical protein OB955_09295 [Halobacteria archaeon AArc-m2/3/4]|uniref:Uncharacterized protein n=1 Tax=Natronoglomus mannanivorans TaxID=2979990 RepID=A0ABT2QDC8_9EURY|nr:hypothetical protein [Halobacteria archaeon AArc-m2/3/4]